MYFLRNCIIYKMIMKIVIIIIMLMWLLPTKESMGLAVPKGWR